MSYTVQNGRRGSFFQKNLKPFQKNLKNRSYFSIESVDVRVMM